MKIHLKTTTILIGILLLGLAIAKIDAVFYGVIALSVLGIMYTFIYLTIIRNQGGNNEQAMIDYNKMEEEWEMDNYNEIKDEQQ